MNTLAPPLNLLVLIINYYHYNFIIIVMLSWFVDKQVKESVLSRKRVVEESDVEIRPERIPSSCLDENICIQSIQKYFSVDAWAAVEQVLEVVKRNPVWFCGNCARRIDDDTESSIICESCLSWFHFDCVGLKKSPKSRQWFCRQCHIV